MASLSNVFGAILGKAGKAIDTLGRGGQIGLSLPVVGTIKPPELKISENLQRIGGQLNPVKQASASQGVLGAYSQPFVPNGGYNNAGELDAAARNFQAGLAGSTGGQAVGGGGGGGGSANLQAPIFNPPDTSSIDALRGQYAQAANDISNQGGILDQQYNLAKGDIQTSIDQNVAAAESQKQSVDQQFGDVLKNQLKTYQDLGRQRQGTFSALGTLDSSAFGEQQFRADQQLAQDRTTTDTERTKTLSGIDTQLNTYKKQATSQLASLALQWQQGKNAIASALANNNLQEASAIQQALSQVRDQYAQIQNSVINFQNQAQLLKAQGVNVKTSILGSNGNDYAKQVAGQLGNLLSTGNAMYSLPVSATPGQGFISQGNRAKIDPITGLPLSS